MKYTVTLQYQHGGSSEPIEVEAASVDGAAHAAIKKRWPKSSAFEPDAEGWREVEYITDIGDYWEFDFTQVRVIVEDTLGYSGYA
jgi:hypothetical protein